MPQKRLQDLGVAVIGVGAVGRQVALQLFVIAAAALLSTSLFTGEIRRPKRYGHRSRR